MPLLMSVLSIEEKEPMLSCELCNKNIPYSEAHSLSISHNRPGKGYASYQCVAHIGCCHEHALLAVLACLFEHIEQGNHANQGTPLQHNVLVTIKGILDELGQDMQKGA